MFSQQQQQHKDNLAKPTSLGNQPLFEKREPAHLPKLNISKSTHSLKSYSKRGGSDFSFQSRNHHHHHPHHHLHQAMKIPDLTSTGVVKRAGEYFHRTQSHRQKGSVTERDFTHSVSERSPSQLNEELESLPRMDTVTVKGEEPSSGLASSLKVIKILKQRLKEVESELYYYKAQYVCVSKLCSLIQERKEVTGAGEGLPGAPLAQPQHHHHH